MGEAEATGPAEDGLPEVDWDAFAVELAAFEAERHIDSLVAGGRRVAENLGVWFHPESFVFGALFRDLTDAPASELKARIEAVQRLSRHARSRPL